jgi:tripartite-type tricarboxylate transporter receptor subunit TctC
MRNLLSCIILFIAITCSAQPIEFVVSASAGGPNDTVARKVLEKIREQSDIVGVVINKPGGAHVLAYNYVLNSNKPTIIIETSEIETHEVYKELQPVHNLGYFTNTLFVSEKSGFKNLSDLKRKSNVMFGHGGYGSFSYKAMQSLCSVQLTCTDIPYKSSAEGMLALATGDIDVYAIVSYGSRQFTENPRYVPIYSIKVDKANSWYRVFSKNLDSKDVGTIKKILSALPPTFYKELGLE